jgi:hypothetical protein
MKFDRMAVSPKIMRKNTHAWFAVEDDGVPLNVISGDRANENHGNYSSVILGFQNRECKLKKY